MRRSTRSRLTTGLELRKNDRERRAHSGFFFPHLFFTCVEITDFAGNVVEEIDRVLVAQHIDEGIQQRDVIIEDHTGA